MFDNISEEKREIAIKTLNELSENAKTQSLRLVTLIDMMKNDIDGIQKKVAENESK